MPRSVKRFMQRLQKNLMTKEPDLPPIIDKTGDYDRAEVARSAMPGEGGGH